jgi:putative acetyltransferase
VVLSTSELQVAAMRLYESSGYRVVRKEAAAAASHKSVGAGLARYHYEKALG